MPFISYILFMCIGHITKRKIVNSTIQLLFVNFRHLGLCCLFNSIPSISLFCYFHFDCVNSFGKSFKFISIENIVKMFGIFFFSPVKFNIEASTASTNNTFLKKVYITMEQHIMWSFYEKKKIAILRVPTCSNVSCSMFIENK